MRFCRIALQASLVAALLPTGVLFAQEVVVRATDQDVEFYDELRGDWQNSPVSAELEGLPAGNARMLLPDSTGAIVGAANFRLQAPTAGRYYVDVLWPANANAARAAMVVTATDQPMIRLVDMTPGTAENSLANKWVRLGVVELPEPLIIQATVEGNASVSPVAQGAPHAFAIDSVRLTTDDTAVLDTERVRIPSGSDILALTRTDPVPPQAPGAVTQEMPFDAPPAVAEVDPFAVQPSAPQDPFSVPPQNEASDPFAVADQPAQPTGETASPFTGTEPGQPADPFAVPPSVAEPGDPFSTGPAVAQPSDPFATQPSAPAVGRSPMVPEDPFAVVEQGAPSSPFSDVTLPSDPMSQARAENARSAIRPPVPPSVGEVESPFATGPENVDDPFSTNVEFTGTNRNQPLPFPGEAAVEVVADPIATPVPVEEVAMVPVEITPEPTVALPYRDSIDEAVRSAEQTGRKVLVLFSGESTRASFVERALATPEVAAQLEDFELVKINYRENRPLARKYAVTDFPYIVIINRHGFTEGHVIPSSDRDQLRRKLTPYIQTYF